MESLDLIPKNQKPSAFLMENGILFPFGKTNGYMSIHQNFWTPPTDVYETEDMYIVNVEIGGMDENDFIVKIDQYRLTIRGVRSNILEPRAFHRMEINYGEFITEIELPGLIDNDHIEANYKNGFLRIILPKAKPRQIPIEGK
jgi:HSP20 family protein